MKIERNMKFSHKFRRAWQKGVDNEREKNFASEKKEKLKKWKKNVYDKFLHEQTCRESKSAETESNQVEKEKKFMKCTKY